MRNDIRVAAVLGYVSSFCLGAFLSRSPLRWIYIPQNSPSFDICLNLNDVFAQRGSRIWLGCPCRYHRACQPVPRKAHTMPWLKVSMVRMLAILVVVKVRWVHFRIWFQIMKKKFSMNSVKRSIQDFDYRPLPKNRGFQWDLSSLPSFKDGHPKSMTKTLFWNNSS